MTRRTSRRDPLPPPVRAIADARDRLATARRLARHGTVMPAELESAAVDLMLALAALDVEAEVDAEGEL